MKNSGNKDIVSSWLPKKENTSSIDLVQSLESRKNALIWLYSALPLEERPPIRAENRTSSNFNQTIIQMFGGQPTRAVPKIQNHRNGQSILDFLGNGFAIQGPANHSQPSTSSHQKPSVNQGSLWDFMAKWSCFSVINYCCN